jgi:coproporphyrinogen III oxidase-like Fe-S oxidoreductase
MDDNSLMQAISELIAKKKGVEITCEATIGKINGKEITS